MHLACNGKGTVKPSWTPTPIRRSHGTERAAASGRNAGTSYIAPQRRMCLRLGVRREDSPRSFSENCPQDERHRIVQADALRLPFAPGQYDVVFCLGVIQHTPRPEETIERLYTQVKPGGWLVIDHYTYNLSWFTKTAPLIRRILRRLPPEAGLHWTEWLVRGFFPLHRAARGSRIAQALLSRISPVASYYHAFPLDDELQREWSFLDTHDSLTAWYHHFRTKGQIRRSMEGLGAVVIRCEYGGNGVEARCCRPMG